MKAITLLVLILQPIRSQFELKSFGGRHLEEGELPKVNELLSRDNFFKGLEEVKKLGVGGFGLAVMMKRKNGQVFAVKIGNDKEIVDNKKFITKKMLEIPGDLLNLSVRGLRVEEFLNNAKCPFISHTISYRHLLFNKKPQYNYTPMFPSTKVVSVMELGDPTTALPFSLIG